MKKLIILALIILAACEQTEPIPTTHVDYNLESGSKGHNAIFWGDWSDVMYEIPDTTKKPIKAAKTRNKNEHLKDTCVYGTTGSVIVGSLIDTVLNGKYIKPCLAVLYETIYCCAIKDSSGWIIHGLDSVKIINDTIYVNGGWITKQK